MRKAPNPRPAGDDEFARIAWLHGLFSKLPSSRSISLGIGDDAAVLRGNLGNWVWTVDACVEGVHFDWRWLSPSDVGWRSFHAATSDVAAMGAKPIAALCSLALPKNIGSAVFRGIARGQAAAARSLGFPIIGGNLASASEVSIHTTVLGAAKRPLRRDGARISDEIWLLGQVGAAAAGLSITRNVPAQKQTAAERWCARQWKRPQALISAGYELRSVAHACVDVSDGLAADLGHIADASGVRAVIDASALEQTLDARLRRAASGLEREPLELALFGGEDYALLATGPSRKRPPNARVIGQIEKGRGVWLQSGTVTRRLAPVGFDHFR